MIIQQQTKVLFWGWSDPGEKISFKGSWLNDSSSTVADTTGHWTLQLDSPAAGGPFNIIIQGKNRLVLHDVLVGELWLASGQSNMAMPLKQCHDAKSEIAAADYPEIRFFHVEHTYAARPQQECAGSWEYCSPDQVADFSGVAYFFGRYLHQILNVPIGLISASKGGSPAEAWLKKESLESDSTLSEIFNMWKDWEIAFPTDEKKFEKEYDEWQKNKENAKIRGASIPAEPVMPISVDMIKKPHRRPGALYNSMIAPLIPLAIKGVIWYQGENNVERPDQYFKLFPALINSWRDEWGIGDFPFYYVQLAPYRYKNHMDDAARLREAQYMAGSLPKTGMVVTTDLGEMNNIHPKNKQEIGRRLALWALAKTYGYQKIVYSGPEYTSMNLEEEKIRIHFKCLGSGLKIAGEDLHSIEIAGKDAKFLPAQAVINDSAVIVFSKKVEHPQMVRYGWDIDPEPNLFNNEGLPAVPFRTNLKW